MEFIYQPVGSPRLGDFLQENLGKGWPFFRAAIAFVKRSGTRHVINELKAYSSAGRSEIIVGIDHLGTSKEGLEDLIEAVGTAGRIVVFNNAIASTFHPKIYLFRSDAAAEVLVGSGNMTEGGLFTNYEASIRLALDLKDETQKGFLKSIEDVLDGWADLRTGTAQVLDAPFLAKLVANGYVPVEALLAPRGAGSSKPHGNTDESEHKAMEIERLFLGRSVPRPPSRVGRSIASGSSTSSSAAAVPTGATPAVASTPARGFVMTLHQTDAGAGQTTKGASRRSPELFIPLAARNAEPEFWGWDEKFTEDRAKPGKFDRVDVPMQVGGSTVLVNMMTWPDKHDFRLRNEALRSGGSVGSIIVIERADPASEFEYVVQFIPPVATLYPVYFELCTESVRNSKKQFGYY